jgi:hypothetical protein
MNEESLKMAERELGKVTDLFGRILLFWEQFSAKLSTLTKSHDTIETYIEFITNDDLVEEIDESVTTVKRVKLYNLYQFFEIYIMSKYSSDSINRLVFP